MSVTYRLSQRLIFAALYELDVPYEDPLARKVEQGLYVFGQSQLQGTFPVLEKFPWLRFMPTWFPGCRFKQIAAECRKIYEDMNLIPFEMALDNTVSVLGV